MMLLLLALAVAPGSACVPIDHEHILGRDLARANSAFTALPTDMDLGLAPAVGTARVMPARELQRIADAHAIRAQFSDDVCFSWATRPLSIEAIAHAMEKALLPRRVHVDVLDQSSWPVPDGDVVFHPSGLTFGLNGIAFWRGYVNYGLSRHFSVWARVRVTVQENHLFAADKIEAGEQFSAAKLRAEAYDGVLTREDPFTDLRDLNGQIAKFDIAPGALITRPMARVPHTVERGDAVTVTSTRGSARVEAQCIADESGGMASVITVHNARTGRRLRVLVEAKNKAILASDDALGLTTEGPNQ